MLGGNRQDFFLNTLQQRAFIAATQTGPVAGQYSHVQLWNPAASGVLVILTGIDTFVDAVAKTYYQFRRHNVAMAGFFGSGFNKYLGGVVSSATIQIESNAVLLGTTMFFKERILEAGNFKQIFKLTDPIMIPAGYGLASVPSTVNVENSTIFEWIEVDV